MMDLKGTWNTKNGAIAEVAASPVWLAKLMPWTGTLVELDGPDARRRKFTSYWDKEGKSPITGDWDLMEKQTPKEQKR